MVPVLGLLVRGLDLGHTAALVRRTPPADMVLAGVLAALGTVLMSAGWWSLLETKEGRPPFGATLRVYLVGLFFAAFTPAGVGGDLTRIAALPGSSIEAADRIVLNLVFRISGVAALLLLGAAPLVAGTDQPAAGFAALGLAVLVFVLAAGAALGRASLRALERRGPTRLATLAERLVTAAFVLKRQPAKLVSAAAVIIGAQIVLSATAYPLARGMGLDLPLLWLLSAMPLVRLVAFLPITPNGIGVYEGAAVVLFRRMGVDADAALALAVLDHLLISAVPLAGAVVFVFGGGSRRRHIHAADHATL
ncbi:MAG: flippase-like domain-containing protein [Chloroflexi bacterium]|nr:flippase-like domain-containing protein [Chloroflexota bacterium]